MFGNMALYKSFDSSSQKNAHETHTKKFCIWSIAYLLAFWRKIPNFDIDGWS